MNRGQLARALARRLSWSVIDAKRAVDLLFGSEHGHGLIVDALDRGERVVISGFGTFRIRLRLARRIRNPGRPGWMTITAGREVRFRPGASLKRRMG